MLPHLQRRLEDVFRRAFYTSPLVYNISCADDLLTFSTQSNFKRNNPYTGSYKLRDSDDDDSLAASGDITFLPHWRANYVEVSFSGGSSEKTLTVTSEFGDETVKTVSC